MEYAAPAYLPPLNVAGGVPAPQALAPAQCAPPSLHGGHSHYGQEAEMEDEEEDELSRYLVPRWVGIGLGRLELCGLLKSIEKSIALIELSVWVSQELILFAHFTEIIKQVGFLLHGGVKWLKGQ